MKLTQTQIKELYKFTRKHYVEYYDVQTELVDHLANDIEEIWQEYPNLSFEDARDKSFKKFGVFGFMNVVDAKVVQMNKKYYKVILKFAREWFQLPKIILTIALFFGFYQLQELEISYLIYNVILFSIFIIQIVVLVFNSRKLKKKYKITQKSWLFESILQTQGYGNSVLMLFYGFYFLIPGNSIDFMLMGNFRSVLTALFATVFILVSYITLVVIPKKANQLLAETYPEYKLI
ncbi:hypothetical protein [uncultured Polaribacter sp.]|uniref:hypothetical protein n=1 Tax=uncultured Polaribacter sp. TaxID=174711 RepID=UPI00262F231D|nr:hypothetical protein [uncultured Polaribacter sp.]